jgi:23S rRNA (adenine2503-C2)-methyltransferase
MSDTLLTLGLVRHADLERRLLRNGVGHGTLRRLRRALFRGDPPLAEVIAELPPDAAELVRSLHQPRRPGEPGTLELVRRLDSERDGASKLLFRNAAGLTLETVILRIGTGRTSLCVSSQVGCAAACAFCATGRMGIARSLSAEEIVGQARVANDLLAGEGRRVRNVVFMGMGEPLHNEDEVYPAIEALIDPKRFGLSPNHVVLSTVGIPDAMLRFAERFPAVGLALSLHAARQEVRQRIVPLAGKYPLEELLETMRRVQSRTGRPIFLEYIMLAGINDADEDRAALIERLTGLDAHLNLIPYNRVEEAPELVGTDPERIREFSDGLKRAGLKVTTRYSLGSDIAAACGQLVRRENRELGRRGRAGLLPIVEPD